MTLQQLLGIELPIIQAPMAGVQGSALAIAVSNAGGLGSLPCAMLSLDALRNELAAIKARTDQPFNVNFFCHAPPAPSAEREAAWRVALAPYYKEYGIDPDTIQVGPGRAPFSAAAADLLDEFKPPVVSFHFGLAIGRLAGASESNRARRYCLRQPPSKRRAGSKHRESMPSLPRVSRRADIVGSFSRRT